LALVIYVYKSVTKIFLLRRLRIFLRAGGVWGTKEEGLNPLVNKR